jgi:hypothetical protein
MAKDIQIEESNKVAGDLFGVAYEELVIAYANTSSKDMPIIAGSREQEVACARLILEKQKAEEQKVLQEEVGAIDLAKSHIRKVNSGLADVTYEVRMIDVRIPDDV